MPTLPAPPLTDLETWQKQLDELRLREKAHTREGDAIAAARRRLPMVEVDPTTHLIGADGPVPLLDGFEGRTQFRLDGRPIAVVAPRRRPRRRPGQHRPHRRRAPLPLRSGARRSDDTARRVRRIYP